MQVVYDHVGLLQFGQTLLESVDANRNDLLLPLKLGNECSDKFEVARWCHVVLPAQFGVELL